MTSEEAAEDALVSVLKTFSRPIDDYIKGLKKYIDFDNDPQRMLWGFLSLVYGRESYTEDQRKIITSGIRKLKKGDITWKTSLCLV